MSVFHRLSPEDARAMPAQRFINFAHRLVAYKGVIRAHVEAQALDEQRNGTPAPSRPASALPSGDVRQNRTVPSDAHTLTTDPALAGLFEQKAGTDG